MIGWFVLHDYRGEAREGSAISAGPPLTRTVHSPIRFDVLDGDSELVLSCGTNSDTSIEAV